MIAAILHSCHITRVSLKAAILGFLELEPTTGYTLRQRFDGSVGSFWTVTQSQIYRELHALADAKLVAMHVERGEGKPDRKVYALTPAGRAALASWLRAPLEPLQLRHPLLLKFVFAADVAPNELDQVLQRYGDTLDATRAEYAARAHSEQIFALARNDREATLWSLSIEHGLAWCDAELAWLTRARRELTSSKPRRRGRRIPKR
jgi:PadR family transcriptional regulator AphA